MIKNLMQNHFSIVFFYNISYPKPFQMRFKQDSFKRRMYPETMYDINDDIIISNEKTFQHNKNKYNIIDNMHVSILQHLTTYLSWEDMAAMKNTSKNLYRKITVAYIVDLAVSQSNPSKAMCEFALSPNTSYLRYLLENYTIPDSHIRSAVIFTVMTKRNGSAKVLCDFVRYSKHNTKYVHDFKLRYYDCQCASCMYHSMEIDADCNTIEGGTDLFSVASLRSIVRMCVATDNMAMFKHLLQKHNITFDNTDIWPMLTFKSKQIFHEMLRMKPKMQINQKMFRSYVNLPSFAACVDFAAYMFEWGVVKLGRKLFALFLAQANLNYQGLPHVNTIVKIITVHGTHSMIQGALKQFIHKHLITAAQLLIGMSPRIVYKQKYLDILVKHKDFYKVFPAMEYILANKLALQERLQNQMKTNVL